MIRAIAMPYCVDQNEPSCPLPFIVELDDNVKARDAKLKQLFNDHVMDIDEEDGCELIVRKGKKNESGDLIVEYGDDLFLFLTYIKE